MIIRCEFTIKPFQLTIRKSWYSANLRLPAAELLPLIISSPVAVQQQNLAGLLQASG
jgi:hypothetical protein